MEYRFDVLDISTSESDLFGMTISILMMFYLFLMQDDIRKVFSSMTVICCWIKSMIKIYQNACQSTLTIHRENYMVQLHELYLPEYLYTNGRHWARYPDLKEILNLNDTCNQWRVFSSIV